MRHLNGKIVKRAQPDSERSACSAGYLNEEVVSYKASAAHFCGGQVVTICLPRAYEVPTSTEVVIKIRRLSVPDVIKAVKLANWSECKPNGMCSLLFMPPRKGPGRVHKL